MYKKINIGIVVLAIMIFSWSCTEDIKIITKEPTVEKPVMTISINDKAWVADSVVLLLNPDERYYLLYSSKFPDKKRPFATTEAFYIKLPKTMKSGDVVTMPYTKDNYIDMEYAENTNGLMAFIASNDSKNKVDITIGKFDGKNLELTLSGFINAGNLKREFKDGKVKVIFTK
jgi:hypothetical protein